MFSKQISISSFATSFIFFIRPSDSLAYIKPLVIISGPDTILYVSLFIATTIVTIPSLAKSLLSLKTILPTSPIPIPSTNTTPVCTFSVAIALSWEISKTWPVSNVNTFDLSIPNFKAKSLWCFRCLYSPCTGIKYLGFTNVWINFNSSLYACPDTCISSKSSYITSTPFLYSWFITLDTNLSFPGIGDADIINKSSCSIDICLCDP